MKPLVVILVVKAQLDAKLLAESLVARSGARVACGIAEAELKGAFRALVSDADPLVDLGGCPC